MNNDSEEFKKRTNHLSEVTEEIYQAIFSSIDEGFCIIEIIFDDAENPSDYLFLETNAVFEDMTGLKNPNGKTALELVPDLEKKWIEIYGNVAITGKPIRFTENSVPMGRWFDVYAMKVGGNDSNLVAILFRDITKIKRHDENLAFIADIQADLVNLTLADEIMQSVSQKLSAYLNISHCLFAKIDQANNRAVVQFDWHQKTTASLKGDYRLSDFVSSEFLQQNQAGNTLAINNTQADPRTDAVEFAALDIYSFITVPFHKLGEWKYLFMVYDSAARVWEKDEIELIQEITSRIFPRLERAWAEESLRESEKQLRAFSKNLPGGAAFIVNQDLQYLLADGEALKIANFTPENFLGKTIFEVFPPELIAEYLPIYQKALNGEYLTYEHSAHGRNYLTRCVPLYDTKGAVNAALAMSYDITERKETEDKLRETTAVLSAINENTPTLIYFKDRESRILSANPATVAIIGKPLEEIIGKTPSEYLDDNEEGAKIRENDQRIIKNGKTETLEELIKTDDGEHIFLSTKSPYFDENNEIIGLVGVSIDITERKKAEADLQEKDKLLSRLTNVTPTLLAHCTKDYRYLFVNQTLADFLGLKTEEIIGESVPKIMGEKAFSLVLPYVKKVLSGERVEFESEIPYSTAGKHYMHVVYVPEFDKQNNVIGWFATITDITDRKEAERVNSFLASIIESSNDAIISKDLNGVIISWNQSAEKMFGYKKDEIVGKSVATLIPNESKYEEDLILQKLRSGIGIQHYETKRQRKDGTQLDVSLTISPILNKEGKIIGASKIVRDISERKRTEEELVRSNEFHSIIAAISTDWAYSARVKPDGSIITDAVTEGFTKQLGYTLEELIENGGWESIVHSEDLPKANEQMKKLMSGEIITGRLRHNSKYGHTIVSEYQTSPIVDKDGKVVRIYGANRDITSQILSEQLIRESESRLRTIIESATDYAIFTLTLNGTINSWSPGAEKIFGHTEMEVIGNKVDILFTPANRENNIPAKEMENALIKGRATDDRFHLRKDGTRFFASGVMMPILRNGIAEGFVKIARDMTAQIAADKAIREKEMLKKLFIAQESERQRIARDLHDELGQQLTALRLQLANALRVCKDENLRSEINNIQSIAKQIDNGVDFLAWELRPAVLDDLGLTAAFEKFVKEVANYSGVRVELLPTSLKGIRFPSEIETNLYRILQEALNNINKHSKAKNAEILLERRDDILLLIISDNGIGFNPKKIKTNNKGIGLLGMRERATIIGGTIEIESTPGQGTSIYVKVPGLFN